MRCLSWRAVLHFCSVAVHLICSFLLFLLFLFSCQHQHHPQHHHTPWCTLCVPLLPLLGSTSPPRISRGHPHSPCLPHPSRPTHEKKSLTTTAKQYTQHTHTHTHIPCSSSSAFFQPCAMDYEKKSMVTSPSVWPSRIASSLLLLFSNHVQVPFDSSTAVLQEMDDDQKLEDVRKRLQKEKEIKAATMKLRDFQQSEAAKAACDATMEESQQRINYFQNEFDKLQLKKQESSPKVPRTQIAITLPSMENAPPMMKAGFDSQGRSYSGQSPDMRMNPSRKASDSSSHYPDDFISHRPLSTVGMFIPFRFEHRDGSQHSMQLHQQCGVVKEKLRDVLIASPSTSMTQPRDLSFFLRHQQNLEPWFMWDPVWV